MRLTRFQEKNVFFFCGCWFLDCVALLCVAGVFFTRYKVGLPFAHRESALSLCVPHGDMWGNVFWRSWHTPVRTD